MLNAIAPRCAIDGATIHAYLTRLIERTLPGHAKPYPVIGAQIRDHFPEHIQ
jgi:hypothetical protein